MNKSGTYRTINKVLLLALLLLSGCVHRPLKSPIAAFSSAASSAASDSIGAFDAVERGYKQTQINALVLNYDTQGFHPEATQPFMSEEDRNARVLLLKALQRYAETLSALIGDKTN